MPKDVPPSDFGNAFPIGGDVYYTRIFDENYKTFLQELHFWHWCTELKRWRLAGVWNHNLISEKPLHLEPSLLWPCCGKHGFVRNGRWEDA